MASSSVAMKLPFILLLLTLFSSMKTQARDSQFFNKVSSTTVVPNKEQTLNNNQQEPNFLPANDNGYGLYGHESGQLPPSATTATEPTTTTTTATRTAEPTTTSAVSKEPLHKYLPKNYNPVAYVTEPENVDDSNSFSEDTYTNNLNNDENNNYNDAQNNYENQGRQQEYQTGQPRYRSYTASTLTANSRYSNNNNFNYNGGSSFNSGPQGLSDTSFTGNENKFYNGDEETSFRPQGMSDTRSLENGKYFYDVGNGRFSGNHPYESLSGVRARNEYNDRNYYGNSYQNQYEFPDEQNLP